MVILAIIVSLCALFLSIYTFIVNRKIQKLRKFLLSNQPPLTLEENLNLLYKQIKTLQENQNSLSQDINDTQITLKQAIQKTGLVKYNSLQNDGGKFSFSYCMLNYENNGVILSSLYGRDQNRVYIKNISEGKSEIPLTNEEINALKIALSHNKEIFQLIPEN